MTIKSICVEAHKKKTQTGNMFQSKPSDHKAIMRQQTALVGSPSMSFISHIVGEKIGWISPHFLEIK